MDISTAPATRSRYFRADDLSDLYQVRRIYGKLMLPGRREGKYTLDDLAYTAVEDRVSCGLDLYCTDPAQNLKTAG